MSPEAQQIAIAEACGWEFAPGYPVQLAQNKTLGIPWQYINGQHYTDGTTLKGIPDYLNDLNACHEAEKSLNTSQYWAYVEWCHRLTKIRGVQYVADRCSATANQRAEAFLRTLNLWDDYDSK